ncbi:GDSL-type esterase/lipase family protein [Kitasatospora viridis]|uniref:Lysophospholipase L1-like esterase n=1 Tax=Kitasatospora viridis TaxID=281105 RepID=A0A561S9X2_9ACTN|nr:GDSL-type esterase/lipase family protein [Kitasatospora viridis]TWF71679.1 lysophospholipase L1-like esterase [Kitasatospora viridis]
MGITQVTVRGTYVTGTTPSAGTVQLQLTAPVINGGQIAEPVPVSKALDAQGKVSFTVPSPMDDGTFPVGVMYRVDEALTGQPVSTYYIKVPADGSVVDLQAVVRQTTPPPQIVVLQSLNQRGLPGGYPELDGSGKILAVQLPDGLTPGGGTGGGGTGGVTSVNGKTAAVVLTAADLGALSQADADARYATKGSGLTSVNGKIGVVVLSAGDVGALSQADADARYATTAQLPTSLVTSVFGRTGAVVVSAADIGALTQAAADGRYVQPSQLPVLQVNGKTGVVVLGAGDVRAVPASDVGAANGVAALDATGHLAAAQLPSNVVTQAQVGVTSGIATLDTTGRVPASQAPLGAPLGIYVPPGWGQFWRAKRSAASTGLATVAAVGSSSTQGLYASNLVSTSWVGRLASSLQATYGDGGSGYFSTGRSAAFLGTGASVTAWQGTPGNLVTQSGTWGVGNRYGPGANFIYTSTNGSSLTFTVRGSTVRVYTLSGAGRVNWTYSIDGNAAVSVADSGTAQSSIQVTTITGLSSGTHTVTITHNGAAGSYLSVCGVTAENASGIVVNNYGLAGAGSASFAYNTVGTAVANWSGGPDYPADLVIYMLGSNDVLTGMTADTWSSNLRQYLSAVKDGTTVGGTAVTGTSDVMIVMQHIGAYDNANYRYQDYAARGRMVAEAYGAAFVDLWPMGRNSWNYWASLGYWGNEASVGNAGTDTIHMSDAGHQFTANTILSILTA